MFLGIQTPSDLGAGLSGQKQEEEADGYQWRKLTAIRVWARSTDIVICSLVEHVFYKVMFKQF